MAKKRPSIGPIAIDGPAAAGKTSVGRALARHLGYRFLDTGLMYRAFTLAALRAHVPSEDEAACAELARHLPMRIELEGDTGRVFLGDEDVTDRLREEDVEASVSRYSAIAAVREAMVARQRDLAASGEIILAGRDIGTVVVPGAPVKLFLTASEEARAGRRSQQAGEWGQQASTETSLRQIEGRDRVDSSRTVSPLRPADDAIVIDTTDLSLDEAVGAAIEAVEQRRPPAGAGDGLPRQPRKERTEAAPRRKRLDPFIPWVYWWAHYTMRFLLFVITRFKVYGRENVPRTGPLIVATNHLNNLDPIIMSPAIGRRRRIRFMAKVELFRGPFGFMANLYGAFPLRRFEGDLGAVLTAERILRGGGVVGMFPEGTRSRTQSLAVFHPGTATLALRTGATLLPCAITGTEKLRRLRSFFTRPRIVVRIGEPIPVERRKRPTPEEVSALTARLREAIAALLPPRYGGTYTG